MKHRILPLIISVALFMENIDSTVIATSLPAIAEDLQTNPVSLKLAITSYLIALAIFIPASGWAADRFGARRVFRYAIAIFVIGSIACAFASSLLDFILARSLQGMGGAMMTPIGRLLILRSVEKKELVGALAWLSIPALAGPLLGPPLGGFITTFFSWEWIFLINVPIGILGIILAGRFIPNITAENVRPLDRIGFALSGLACFGLVFGLSVISLATVPVWIKFALLMTGAIAAVTYVPYARRTAEPLLDLNLLKITSFRICLLGGWIFRISAGAAPFLLPLMFQIGFGLTPFQSGMLTFAGAIGALAMKFVAGPILRRFGFRFILIANSLIGTAFLALNGLFTPETSHILIFVVLLTGGFFRSLQFTSMGALSFADIDTERMSKATTLSAVSQRISLSMGVAIAAVILEVSAAMHGGEMNTHDFMIAFFTVSGIAALSVFVFVGLPENAGAEVSGKQP